MVYPREHERLAAAIAAAGAVVSEFPPGTPPLPHHFPLRNRVISGLARAVVVLEASARSGSLITARAALEQGRDVLAVPGSVLSGRSSGCHALIKDGAPLVETVEDVLAVMGWTPAGAESERVVDDKSCRMSGLERAMALGEVYTVDELAAKTGQSVQELLSELGRLEVGGRLARVAGGFVRLDESGMDGSNV